MQPPNKKAQTRQLKEVNAIGEELLQLKPAKLSLTIVASMEADATQFEGFPEGMIMQCTEQECLSKAEHSLLEVVLPLCVYTLQCRLIRGTKLVNCQASHCLIRIMQCQNQLPVSKYRNPLNWVASGSMLATMVRDNLAGLNHRSSSLIVFTSFSCQVHAFLLGGYMTCNLFMHLQKSTISTIGSSIYKAQIHYSQGTAPFFPVQNCYSYGRTGRTFGASPDQLTSRSGPLRNSILSDQRQRTRSLPYISLK